MCTLPFTGDKCHGRKDYCRDFDASGIIKCHNGGTCRNTLMDTAPFWRCDCVAPWSEPNCLSQSDYCTPNPCRLARSGTGSGTGRWSGIYLTDYGDCSTILTTPYYNCDCPITHSGARCEIDVNECQVNPCLNSGVCSETTAEPFYQCDCHQAYEGDICQTVKSHCDPNPCVSESWNQNPYPCSLDLEEIAQLGNGPFFTCGCPKTHTGSLCKIDVNECNPNPCDNNGVCTQEVPPLSFPYYSCTGCFIKKCREMIKYILKSTPMTWLARNDWPSPFDPKRNSLFSNQEILA